MALALIFLIGLLVGFVAQRYAFCVFGALVELLTLGRWRRIAAVAVAMSVFGLVQLAGYRHGVEYPSALFLVGGLIQGVGYYLAMGCPLGLLVHLGEGSTFHLVVLVAFAVGAALYAGLLQGPVAALLGPLGTERVQTWTDLILLAKGARQ